MNERTRRWIDALKLLDKDPRAAVPCPNCQNSVLVIHDVAGDDWVDRHMVCTGCGAQEVATVTTGRVELMIGALPPDLVKRLDLESRSAHDFARRAGDYLP
jgi:hypothetical protein